MTKNIFGSSNEENISFTRRLTLEELILLVQCRNIDPVKILFERFSPLIEKVVNRFYITAYEKEDIRQECRILAFEAFNSYRNDMNVTPGWYVKYIVEQGMIDLIRKDHAQKRTIDRVVESLEKYKNSDQESVWESVLPSSLPLADEQIILKENYDHFLKELSNFEKEVFDRYVQGESIIVIAENLGESVKKITNALFRCRKKMKYYLSSLNY